VYVSKSTARESAVFGKKKIMLCDKDRKRSVGSCFTTGRLGNVALVFIYCTYFCSLLAQLFVNSCSTCDFSRAAEKTNQALATN